MRVLLSTIGSRGDVQPLVALALQLRALGTEVRMCVPPDFRDWIEGLGIPITPIGPELRKLTAATPAAGPPVPPSPERMRELVEGTVAAQFHTIAGAADGCDIIAGATALQIAAPSVAEKLGLPYVFVTYCPRVLPSPRHPPIPLGMLGQTAAIGDNGELWAAAARRSNETWRDILNRHRVAIGLAPVVDVTRHVLTDAPWLATDPTLGPWPDAEADPVFQPGAWIVADERPLPPEVEAFLAAGEAPIYFGFGSIRATPNLSQAMIASARALGRRAIVSRGWADLVLPDETGDCLAVGEVNQQALFPRVAAAVHHGGAGTTTAAAMAGTPQVIVPQMYDQPYWASRVADLGIGVAHAQGTPTAESLTRRLEAALAAKVATQAKSVASVMRHDGALVGAIRVVEIARAAKDRARQ
jgi:vancomycin aglycone glucosyltransferase